MLSDDHTALTQILFSAITQGDYTLANVLLGPSHPPEKQEFCELSAKINTNMEHQRLYTFMSYLTKVRMQTLGEFAAMKPAYHNFEVLREQIQLNDKLAMDAQITSFEDQLDVNSQLVFEVNDDPLISIALNIDKNHHQVMKDSTTIASFLNDLHIPTPPDSTHLTVTITGQLKTALMALWKSRFLYRLELIKLPEIQSLSDVEHQLQQLTLDFELYEDEITRCDELRDPLRMRCSILENAYIDRIHYQIEVINKLMLSPERLPSTGLLPHLEHCMARLHFVLNPDIALSLKGTEDEPEKVWLSPTLTDANNNTLLHVAAQHSRYRLVGLLLKHGIPLDALNFEGKTPSMLAALTDENLLNRAKMYDRDKKSDFLTESHNAIKAYKDNALKIYHSWWRREIYSYFNDFRILYERLHKDIPELEQSLWKSSHEMTDMSFVIDAIILSQQAKRGLTKQSSLFDTLMQLIIRYFTNPAFGVKHKDEIGHLMALVNNDTPDVIKRLKQLVSEKDKTIEDTQRHVEELSQTVTERGVLINNLQQNNEELANSLSRSFEQIQEKDRLLHQRDIELESFQSRLKVNEEAMSKTQTQLATLQEKIDMLLVGKSTEKIATREATTSSITNHPASMFG